MSTSTSRSRSAGAAIFVSILCSVVSGVWAQTTPPAGSTTPAAAAAKPPTAEESAKILSRRMWWNRTSIVEALKLSVHQREMMDAQFEAHFDKEREARGQVHEQRKQFDDQLQKGHWGAARETTKKLVEAQQVTLENEYGARVDVLSLLTAEQLETMNKTPGGSKLLSSNWASGGGGGGGGSGGGERLRRRIAERRAVGGGKKSGAAAQ